MPAGLKSTVRVEACGANEARSVARARSNLEAWRDDKGAGVAFERDAQGGSSKGSFAALAHPGDQQAAKGRPGVDHPSRPSAIALEPGGGHKKVLDEPDTMGGSAKAMVTSFIGI